MLRKSQNKGPLALDMTNFGASFRKAREAKGISLDQIAQETRISTRFLGAIENEEFDILPGGIFNRGFIRTFAAKVGLDPEQAVADYERLVGTTHETGDATLASANARPAKSELHLYPIAVGVLAIAIAIFYIVTRDSGTSASVTTVTPPVTESTPAAQPVPAPPQAADPTPAPAVTEASTPVATEQAQRLTLDIEAHEKTWIKVTSDGNSVSSGEVLEPGMTRKFTADSSIYISVGNAAGLTLKINEMPLKPLGKSGQVRSVTITQSNLKDFIG